MAAATLSVEQDSRQLAPWSQRPWIIEPDRLEQLQQPVARRTLVPCAFAPDDLEQRIGRGVAVATRHMSGGKGKTLFMVVRAGRDFGQQCVVIVDGCCVLCKPDPRFPLRDRPVAGLVFGKACQLHLGLVHSPTLPT